MSIKVSIILPVYNVEKYLEDCIESAVNQTLDEIEIIAVNDGSTDNSLDILVSYSNKYPNIKIVNQDNKGLSGARNSGLKIAKGEYIYFLDSDDYIDTNSMEYCYSLSKSYDLDIITFDADVFLDGGYNLNPLSGNYDRKNKLNSHVMSGEEFYNYSKQNRGYRPPVWLNFYKRKFLENNNLYFYEGIIHEDELFNFKAFLLADKVKYIPKKYFFRRIRPDSIMTKNISIKNYEGFFITAKEAYRFYIENIGRFKAKTKINILNHIRTFYSKCIMYCDKLRLDRDELVSLRNEIYLDIKSKDKILTLSIFIQFKAPHVYYSCDRMKDKLKNTIKKLTN